MVPSRMSLNGMGLFEGSPEEKTNPFVMFNRVQAVPGRTPPAWGRRRRALRAKVVSGDRIKFQSVEVPQISPGQSQRFRAIGARPLPGSYPASILPYGRPGWAFVEPHPSAQGIGDTWSTVTDIVKKGSEYAEPIKNIIGIFRKPKRAQDPQTAPPPPPPPPPPRKDNTLLYVGIGAGVLLVGGLVTFLVLKR